MEPFGEVVCQNARQEAQAAFCRLLIPIRQFLAGFFALRFARFGEPAVQVAVQRGQRFNVVQLEAEMLADVVFEKNFGETRVGVIQVIVDEALGGPQVGGRVVAQLQAGENFFEFRQFHGPERQPCR